MKLNRLTVVEAAPESAYGADPGAGYQGLLIRPNNSITLDGEVITRDVLRNTLSPRGSVIGLKSQQVLLPLELRGAGVTSGDLNVPEVDALLKSCCMAREDGVVLTLTSVSGTFEIGETVNNTTDSNEIGVVADISGTTLFIRALDNAPAASDAITGATSSATATVSAVAESYVYRPISPEDVDTQPSVAIRYNKAGARHLLLGARGTFSLNMTVGQIPSIEFTMTGIYADPTDQPLPTPAYLTLTPQPVLGASLKIGSLNTSLVTVNSVAVDLANTVNPRDDIQAPTGRRGFIVEGRAPTGSVDPEATTLSAFNPFVDWSAANYVPISVGIGNGVGNRVRVVMPATQYTQMQYGERNGGVTYQLPFAASGNDDELMVIYY